MKAVLDACCGSRMFWFDRRHPDVVFMDRREETHTLCDGRTLEIKPDVVGDFREMPFSDGMFRLVVFDPPHLIHAGENSWLAKKYGKLDRKTGRGDLNAGVRECFRVLEPGGILVFKWCEDQISTAEVLKLASHEPLFGHRVITMESSAFRSLTEQIAEIAAHVRAASGDKKAASPDRLLTTREAAHLLNVSTRTLQRMRSEQRIGYVVLRGKCRYRQSEIDRLLEACAVNEDAATPQELKRNHTLRTGGKPKGRRT